MKPYKTVIYSFLVGGTFALIAQAILTFWQTVLVGTPMAFFMGGATLISMGVIGCILGGLACYQYVEEWATFGALLPFSGFAMAVGMKAVGPWTKNNEKMGKCIWNCVWFVVWFNVLFAAICIAIGWICGTVGFNNNLGVAKTEGGMLFVYAFLVGGLLAAFFQILFVCLKKVSKKVTPLHILITAWMLGAIFAPFGISGALANFSGEGFSVMITVGGYNMFNVGIELAAGNLAGAGVHLGSFLLALAGLAITALFTFFMGLLLSRIGKLVKVKRGFYWCSLLVTVILVMPRIGGETSQWMNGVYEAVSVLALFPLIVAMGAGSNVTGKRSVALCKFQIGRAHV